MATEHDPNTQSQQPRPAQADGLPPATPPEAPLDMPVQDFRAAPPPGPAFQAPAPQVVLARLIAFGGAALVTAFGAWQMWAAFGSNILPLQYVLLVLFSIERIARRAAGLPTLRFGDDHEEE